MVYERRRNASPRADVSDATGWFWPAHDRRQNADVRSTERIQQCSTLQDALLRWSTGRACAAQCKAECVCIGGAEFASPIRNPMKR